MMIYLCGPINGCSDDEAINWRDLVKEEFGEENCIDPMRRDYRGIEDESVHAIVDGDKNDIEASDIVLANCWQVSAGTSMEILFAYERSIQVIAVVPPNSKVSPWIRYHAFVVHSLTEAFEFIYTREGSNPYVVTP